MNVNEPQFQHDASDRCDYALIQIFVAKRQRRNLQCLLRSGDLHAHLLLQAFARNIQTGAIVRLRKKSRDESLTARVAKHDRSHLTTAQSRCRIGSHWCKSHNRLRIACGAEASTVIDEVWREEAALRCAAEFGAKLVAPVAAAQHTERPSRGSCGIGHVI